MFCFHGLICEYLRQLFIFLPKTVQMELPILKSWIQPWHDIQSTPVISNSKGLTETLRDNRISTYQSWESEENNKFNNHI